LQRVNIRKYGNLPIIAADDAVAPTATVDFTGNTGPIEAAAIEDEMPEEDTFEMPETASAAESRDVREGSAGNAREEGNEGNEGDEGNEGNEGDEGNEGNEGDEGNEGNEGDEGNEGNEGDEGRKGFEGSKVNEGDEGDQENEGNRRLTG
jgi:hypothetical protein